MTNFKYTIPARPTEYKGTMFRSELEAAWAAFFDGNNIQWEYEAFGVTPLWRPDFYIRPTSEPSSFPVEVKPYQNKSQWENDIATLNKIKSSLADPNTGLFQVGLFGSSPCFPTT